MQATKRLLDIARDWRKTLKKKEKRKIRKGRTAAIFIFIFTFYVEKLIFC